MKRVVILILCSFSFYGIFAQSHRYFIAFTDKANSPFLKAQPEAFLSQKSIQRRTIQNIAIETADLPVDPAYILELRNQGAETFYASRWLNGVLVQATPALAATLEGLPFVKSVEYVASGAPLIYGGRFDRAMDKLDLSSSVDSIQKDLLGIEIMHNQSFLGQGIEIAVLDAGFIGVNSIGAFSHLYQNSKVTNVFNFSGNSTNVYQYHDHGTVVLSTISANIPGYYTGTAPDAEIQLYVTEDVFSEYRVEEYYWLFAAEMADSAGVDIITSSLGYFDFDDPSMNYTPADLNGNTAVISRAADLAALRGMVVITSAGNQGNKAWGKITFPADCHYCLSVGAITKDGELSSFSSHGPTSDDRIKPDVVAMGTGVAAISDLNTLIYKSGTSLSAPQVAGLAAGVWQAFPELTALELTDFLKVSADRAAVPDNYFGYGVPHFMAVKNYRASQSVENEVAVYPNPAFGGRLFIKIKDPDEMRELKYVLYQSDGKKVKEGVIVFTWRDVEQELVVNDLLQGLYIIHLYNDRTNYRKRLLLR